MKQLVSPLAARAQRSLLQSLVGLAVATLVLSLHLKGGRLPATVAQVAAGAAVTAAWLAAVRFLLLDNRGRWVWVVVVLVAGLLAGLGGNAGLGFGIFLSVVLLSVCRFRPWRQVPARRRAIGFGLGIAALVMLAVMQGLWGTPEASGLGRIGRHLGTWAVWSLIVFWSYSLLHLAVNMRLHFLRLRSKLAVSAFLIGLVPLVLMVILGVMMIYTTLGGARAARLSNTLDSWRELTDRGADLGGALFDTTFVWPGAPPAGRADLVVLPAPEWVPGLSRGLRAYLADEALVKRGERDEGAAPLPAVSDTTEFFAAGNEIWLMRWRGIDTPAASVQAWLVGQRPLRKLSGILKTGLDVNDASSLGDTDGGIVVIDTEDEKQLPGSPIHMSISYRDTSGTGNGFWNRYLFFGGTFRDVIGLEQGEVGERTLFIQLRVGWQDLSGEFLTGGSNVNRIVVAVLLAAVFLWLVIEIFAVFFGVRISEGIVAGVHALHRGTRAVAAGDFETVITIPNEDEFGDLAASFNEMTLAVRHGREIALANERLTQELSTARAIQTRLLPRSEPRLLDFEVAGASIPSREIGGDYYDFLTLGPDLLGIAIGDVSGKGMPAALLMANLQASLHGQVLHPGTVAGVVERVNNLIVRSTDPHMFATFFYGVLDAAAATFSCTNAGHNPPVLLRADGTVEELSTGGILLGMLGEQPYLQATVTLAPGEVIVLYTDGITEAVGPSAEEDDPEAMFGEDRLFDVLRRHRHLPAAGIKDAILAAVTEHTAGVTQSDDITLVVVRRQG